MKDTGAVFESYHSHLGYSLIVTVLAWCAVSWYSQLRLHYRPAQRVTLFGLALVFPLCAEAAAFLAALLRPGLDALGGHTIEDLHVLVLGWLPLDNLIDLRLPPAGNRVAVAALLLLALVSLARSRCNECRLGRMLARSRPLERTRHAALLARFRDAAGAGARPLPPVLVIDLAAPLACTTGLLRQRIYLSEGLLALLTPDEALSVLCHEWAHILRSDLRWNWLARLFRDVFCFLPASHLLWHAMIASQDEACDTLAAQLTRQPLTLARAVVKIAKAWHAQPLDLPAAGNMFALPSASPSARVAQMLCLSERGIPAPAAGVYVLSAALFALAILPVLLGC